MKTITKTFTMCAVAALFAPGIAAADDPYGYGWHDPKMSSDYGVSVTLGGGISGFTDQTMRDTVTSTVGGLWDLKATIGSHTPIGLDLSYVGTAANVDALIGAQSGTLVGNTAEAAVRYNILPHYAVNPYAFAGIGYQRYDITGGTFTLSDTGMNESDNAVVFPLGAGVAYRDPSGLVVDLHGTFRPAASSDLVLKDTTGTDNYAPMHTWTASAAIGYEF